MNQPLKRTDSDLLASFSINDISGNGVNSGIYVQSSVQLSGLYWNDSTTSFDSGSPLYFNAGYVAGSFGLYNHVLSGAASAEEECYSVSVIVSGLFDMMQSCDQNIAAVPVSLSGVATPEDVNNARDLILGSGMTYWTTADLAGYGVALESSVQALQNNSNFVSTIPSYLLIPASGYTVYKFNGLTYSPSGNLDDPDSSGLYVRVETGGGISKNSGVYENFGVTTPASGYGAAPSGYVNMIRTGLGQYELYYKLPSTEVLDQWLFYFNMKEEGDERVYVRTTNIASEVPTNVTLYDNVDNANVISQAFKEVNLSGTPAVSGSIYYDIMQNVDDNEQAIIYVSGVVDQLPNIDVIIQSGNAAGWGSFDAGDVAVLASGVWSHNLEGYTASGVAGQKLKNLHIVNLGAAQIVASGSAKYMRIYDNATPMGVPRYTFRLTNFAGGDPNILADTITGRYRIST